MPEGGGQRVIALSEEISPLIYRDIENSKLSLPQGKVLVLSFRIAPCSELVALLLVKIQRHHCATGHNEELLPTKSRIQKSILIQEPVGLKPFPGVPHCYKVKITFTCLKPKSQASLQ